MPLRIAFILDDFPDKNAGTERQFVRLMDHLISHDGFAPSISILRSSNFLRERYAGRVRELAVSSVASPRGVARVLGEARRAAAEADIVHVFFNDASLVFPLPVWLLSRVPVLVSRRDLGFWHTRLTRRIARLNRSFVSRVVCNSRAVANSVMEIEGYPEDRCSVIYNAYVPDDPMASSTQQRDIVAWLDGRRFALIVANLRPIKRVSDAILALAACDGTHADLCLVIVGGDRDSNGQSHREELETLAQQHGVADRVYFAGSVNHPLGLIGQADVCLLCSETEGFSNALMEYASAGRPIICTRAGGNPELVRHEIEGLLYDAGDVSSLASHLDRICSDDAEAGEFASNARKRVYELCSPERVWQAYELLYQSCAGVVSPDNSSA